MADEIEEAQSPLREELQLDIPPLKGKIPCAVCVAYNIRRTANVFSIAMPHTILCKYHSTFDIQCLPVIFTLYPTPVHHIENMVSHVCGCNGCVRHALQYYTSYMSNKNPMSTEYTCGFR